MEMSKSLTDSDPTVWRSYSVTKILEPESNGLNFAANELLFEGSPPGSAREIASFRLGASSVSGFGMLDMWYGDILVWMTADANRARYPVYLRNSGGQPAYVEIHHNSVRTKNGILKPYDHLCTVTQIPGMTTSPVEVTVTALLRRNQSVDVLDSRPLVN